MNISVQNNSQTFMYICFCKTLKKLAATIIKTDGNISLDRKSVV